MVDLLRKDYEEHAAGGVKGRSGHRSLWLSLGLLVAFALVWGALWFWENRLEDSIVELEARKLSISQEEESAPIREATKIEARLLSLSERLRSHSLPAKFLDLLAGLTHPRMQVSALTASFMTGEITVRGEAESIGVLASSLAGWLRLSEVREASVPEIAKRERGVAFRADLSLTPSAFAR